MIIETYKMLHKIYHKVLTTVLEILFMRESTIAGGYCVMEILNRKDTRHKLFTYMKIKNMTSKILIFF